MSEAADHFLLRSTLVPAELRRQGERRAIDRHAELTRALTRLGEPDLAALFATPIVGRSREGAPVAISWYARDPGTPRTLASLDDGARQDVAARLAGHLAALRAIAADPATDTATAALLRQAMSLRGPEDVMAVGGRPVLVNWGAAPVDIVEDERAVAAQFDAVMADPLGAGLPAPDPGAAWAGTGAAGGPGQTEARATVPPVTPPFAPPAVPAGPPGGGRPPLPPGPVAEGPGRPWGGLPLWPFAALCLLMAALLFWLLLPGTRLFPPRPGAVATQVSDAAVETARGINSDLEGRAAELQAALDGGVCTPEGLFLLPDGRTPEGLLPPPEAAEDQPTRVGDGISDPILPPAPARVRPAPQPGGDGTTGSLLDLIEPRTALVIASVGGSTSFGTGFFIAPDLVLTNHHVVEGSLGGGPIFVLNDALGTPQPTTVLHHDGPFEQTGGDFAVLRVDGAASPFYALLDGAVEVKGEAVMAAGFPMDIMEGDLRFQRLVDGGAGQAPDLVVTNGIVNTEQRIADDVTVLVHSASISRGNSGGPLVDLCGRVVGVNTFISEESFRNLNVAQSTGNLLRFLASVGVAPTVTAGACRPSVALSDPAAVPEPADPGPVDPEPAVIEPAGPEPAGPADPGPGAP